MRPAQQREVTLLMTGLHFNTPNVQVKHYTNHLEQSYLMHHQCMESVERAPGGASTNVKGGIRWSLQSR